MSDDGLPPPGSGTPPPPPPPPEPDPGPGEGGIPESEPTTQIPATAAFLGGTAAAGMAAGDDMEPLGDFSDPDADQEPVPWYQQRGPLIAAIVGGIVLLLLAIWLAVALFADDDDIPSTANRVNLSVTDENDDGLTREFTATVVGPDEFPASFLWLRPANATAPAPAVDEPDSDGEIGFWWAPKEEVGDMTRWLSRLIFTEEVPKGWKLPNLPIQCSLERRDQANSIIELTYDVNPQNVNKKRTVTYRFVDHIFQPGDVVRCALNEQSPTTTTTTSTTTTTTSTTTSTTTEPPPTEPPTTPPPTEPPTTPAPTEPPTTPAPTEAPTTPPPTEPPPTEPPASDPPATDTAWDVIQAQDLGDFEALATACNWVADLSDPSLTFTLFAPNDAALQGTSDCGVLEGSGGSPAPALHMHDGEVLAADLAGDITLVSGDTAPADPGSVGGAPIVTPDLDASNGVIHIIGGIIQPN